MEDKRAYLNRGRLLGVRGKFKEAIKEYKSALEIDPNCREARTNLELIYYLYTGKREEEIKNWIFMKELSAFKRN